MYCNCCLWINRKIPGIIEIFRSRKQADLNLLYYLSKQNQQSYIIDEVNLHCLCRDFQDTHLRFLTRYPCLPLSPATTYFSPLFQVWHNWVSPLYFCRRLHSNQCLFCIGLFPFSSWRISSNSLEVCSPCFEIQYISVFALIYGHLF